MSGAGGLITAILAGIGGLSWLGVLITGMMNRKSTAANAQKVKAEAAQIFTDMATKTALNNQQLYEKIASDNDRLRRELDESRRRYEEETRRLYAELTVAREELTETRLELARARRELRQATTQMRRTNDRLDGTTPPAGS